MRAILSLLAAFALLSFAPAASAACTEVVAGIRTCDDNRDGEVDGASFGVAPVGGVTAGGGAGYIDFGSVTIAIAGANADASTPAGRVTARAVAWCFDLDGEPATCENTRAYGLVGADTELVDAQAKLSSWDFGPSSVSQNTVIVSAAGSRVYALTYVHCIEDESLDGCSSAFSSNSLGAQTPVGSRSAFAFASTNGVSTYACAIVVVGACQGVPVSP